MTSPRDESTHALIKALCAERDTAHAELASMTRARDAAHAELASMTRARDAARAELASMTRARDEIQALAIKRRSEIEGLRAGPPVELPAIERAALEWLKQLMGSVAYRSAPHRPVLVALANRLLTGET